MATNAEFIESARKQRKNILNKLNKDENSEFIVIAYNKKNKQWDMDSCTTLEAAEDAMLLMEKLMRSAAYCSHHLKPLDINETDDEDSDDKSGKDSSCSMDGPLKEVLESIIKKIRE